MAAELVYLVGLSVCSSLREINVADWLPPLGHDVCGADQLTLPRAPGCTTRGRARDYNALLQRAL